MREEIFAFLNKTIVEEQAFAISEQQCLAEAELDSFGFIVLWMSIEARYGICLTLEEISDYDYASLTLKTIIDRIIDAQSHQS